MNLLISALTTPAAPSGIVVAGIVAATGTTAPAPASAGRATPVASGTTAPAVAGTTAPAAVGTTAPTWTGATATAGTTTSGWAGTAGVVNTTGDATLLESALTSEALPGNVIVCESAPPDAGTDASATASVGTLGAPFAGFAFRAAASLSMGTISAGLTASDSGRCPSGKFAQPCAANINEAATADPIMPKTRPAI